MSLIFLLFEFSLGMIDEEKEKAIRFQQGLRFAIRSKVVPLAIKDNYELVKKALPVEQDIDDTIKLRSKWEIGRESKMEEKVPK